jgi:DNA-binding response OmpR family regulator
MAANNTLLCIHRDPAQLSLLQENGYDLLTATSGHEGLRLFASQPVDAIVLESHLGLLNGIFLANEIKRTRPAIPIVMLADDLELPYGALNSIDALVTKADGSHFLWATVHFVLNVKPAQGRGGKLKTQIPAPCHPSSRSSAQAQHLHAEAPPDPKAAPFTAKEWRSIRTGTIRF